MARTPAQRGRTGTWLVQARLTRGYETQRVARQEIERLTGWRIPQSQYAEWESGRRVPSEAALERLEAFYGAQTETATPEGMAGLVSLVTELIGELRAERQARVEWEQGFLEAMRELARAGGPQGDPADAPLGDVQAAGPTR